MNDPIDRIAWRPAQDLTANNYNPNIVFSPELRLLEHSLISTGWIQPILINVDDTIIDGFHRWMLSQNSKPLLARYAGRVPVAALNLSRSEAIMLTVRINRAKGSHTALKMADLVKELINKHGIAFDDVARGIGATKDEINLLLADNVFKAKNLDSYQYSRAWYPVEQPSANSPG